MTKCEFNIRVCQQKTLCGYKCIAIRQARPEKRQKGMAERKTTERALNRHFKTLLEKLIYLFI